MPQEPRKYQAVAIQDLRLVFRRVRSSILVAPTGSGKTTIAAIIIDGAKKNGKRVVFLAHRKELIDQCSARLDEQGIDHGIIKAGNKRRNNLPVQVASLMTLVNRVKPGEPELMDMGPRYPADLFIIDECHRATANSYKEILKLYPHALILGLTATPCRTDGRGLGELFQTMVQASTPAELTEAGWLVPNRVFTTPMTPDFSTVKHKKGDFDQAEVEKLVTKAKLVGDIYEHWKELASDRQTVIFAASCRHALLIKEDFLAKGARIEYLDGETPEPERDAILGRLQRRETQIVVNVGILTEGWDNPEISCVVLARPTESLSLYLQMVGRALRPAPWCGKRDCLILDHGGNTGRHGFVTDDREWDLSGRKMPKVAIDSLTTCKKCFAVFARLSACPECGAQARGFSAAAGAALGAIPESQAGKLEEVDPKKQTAEEAAYFQEQLRIQEERGYKENFARARFFERYGRWPGKKHGLKKEWERTTDENGQVKYKLKHWEFKPPAGLVAGGTSVVGRQEVRTGT